MELAYKERACCAVLPGRAVRIPPSIRRQPHGKSAMKRLIVISMPLLLAACIHNPGKKDNQPITGAKEKKAVAYYTKALTFSRPAAAPDSLRYAVSLLDSATSLDAAYAKAYLLKQTYQIRLGKYADALKTLDTLQHLKPHNAQLKSMEGLLHRLRGDTEQARAAWRKSDSLWTAQLDTVSSGNDWGRIGMLLGKAANLKLLGKEQKANRIYRHILKDTSFEKEQYKGMKKTIDTLFLQQSQEEFYQYLIQWLNEKTSASS